MKPKLTEFDFLKRIIKINDCWEFLGFKNPKGYGVFQKMLAHRYSFKLHNGYLPPSPLILRHICDNPICVNPKHLIVGTKKDNTEDRKLRNRSKFDKLNLQSAYDIKYNLRSKDAIKKYCVSRTTVYRIKKNILWKDI